MLLLLPFFFTEDDDLDYIWPREPPSSLFAPPSLPFLIFLLLVVVETESVIDGLALVV